MEQNSITSSGASNAQDFQPPTQNPQGNVGGGLQPNSTTNSSIFNQPGVNQQALPQVNSLRVLSQGTRNSTPAVSADNAAGGLGWGSFLIIFIVVAVITGTLLLRAKSTKPISGNMPSEPLEEPREVKAVPTKPKTKKKSKQKKKKKKK